MDNQDNSIWLFTAQKFDGLRPFTVQANYEGFSEGSLISLLIESKNQLRQPTCPISLLSLSRSITLVILTFLRFVFSIKFTTWPGIEVGDELVIDGGMAGFEVMEKIGSDLRCKCTDPGLFLPRAKLSFWRDGKLVGRNYGLHTLSTKVDFHMLCP